MEAARVTPHEFVTVLNRRWCLNCDLYQSRSAADRPWMPATLEGLFSESCPRTAPRAHAQDQEAT